MTRTSRLWHPNTQMSEWSGFAKIVRARGMHLIDSDGNRMIDGVASMWCNVWGHSRPELVRAMREQAARLQHSPVFNLTHGPAERLADELVRLSPGMHRTFFSDNGSSAMEIAIKIAIQYWHNAGAKQKTRIASLKKGYHGDTFGAMSAGYIPGFFSRFKRQLFDVVQVPTPDVYHWPGSVTESECAKLCLDAAQETLEKDEKIGALIMESGAQVAGGVIIYPESFQKRLGNICRRHGVLLVLDEVATGFGRLGAMVQYRAQKNAPDIVAYGKMLTGGYLTLAATLTTKKVYESFLGSYDQNRHLFHGHTYTANPIASAVAVENLEMYRRHGLIKKIQKTSKMLGGYADAFRELDAVGDVRHKGMLMGIELVSDRRTRKPVSSKKSINKTIFEIGRKNGVYLRTLGNVVMIVPPLAISEGHLRQLVLRTRRTIEEAGF